MLSARAGEEIRVEGLAAGAYDRLVKPFGARELRARVVTAVRLGELRREWPRGIELPISNRCSGSRNEPLISNDEFLIQELLSNLKEHMGLKVFGRAATADNAIELALRHRPAIVLMDMRLQGARDGVDAAFAIHESVGSKIIFITGSKEPKTVTRIHLDHPTAVLLNRG